MDISSSPKNSAQLLREMLSQKVIPKIRDEGVKSTFVAVPSWELLRRAGDILPSGMNAAKLSPLSRSFPGREIRTHGNVIMEEHRWPEEHLLSARAQIMLHHRGRGGISRR